MQYGAVIIVTSIRFNSGKMSFVVTAVALYEPRTMSIIVVEMDGTERD